MGEPVGYPCRTLPVVARTFPSSDAPVLASLGPLVRDGMKQAPSCAGAAAGGREGGVAHEPALATGLTLGARAHCTDGWASSDATGMAARAIASSSSNLSSSSSPSPPNRLPPKEDKPPEKGNHEATSSRGGGVGGGGEGGGGQRGCEDAGRAAERAEADEGRVGGWGGREETNAVAGAVNGGLGAVLGEGGGRAPFSDAADGGMYVCVYVCMYLCVYLCMYTHAHARTHARTHARARARARTHTFPGACSTLLHTHTHSNRRKARQRRRASARGGGRG
jgi:hypothetical protein